MRRLSACNTYIQIEEGSGSVKAFYSYGIHKTVEITGTEDERCHVEVLEQNGERFRWSAKRMYLVGHKMYGISLTPMGYRLFAQQDNDHRMAKSIEDSIDFAAKRQVWQRMIHGIIRTMLIAMNIWPNSYTVLLRGKAARQKAFWLFAII